jgi:hypothetical protein
MSRKHCNAALLGLIPYPNEQGNLFGEQGIVWVITGKPVRRSVVRVIPGHSGSVTRFDRGPGVNHSRLALADPATAPSGRACMRLD